MAPLPLILFALIFLWTPPHFWALALFVRPDYAAAGVPMLPVVAGERQTRRQILGYTLAMIAAALAPALLGLAGTLYAAVATVLSAVFLLMAVRVSLSRVVEPAKMAAERMLFKFSILYLFLLFGALVVDRWWLA